jgi:hypothetical protein
MKKDKPIYPNVPNHAELVLVSDGFQSFYAFRRLLKPLGYTLRWKGSMKDLGDQVYVWIEKLLTHGQSS